MKAAESTTRLNNENHIQADILMNTAGCAVDEATDMVEIDVCLKHHFEQYFQDLEGATPTHLHQMRLTACENPLLQLVMEKSRHNQSLASEWLGINRATLRKKLQQYDLL